MFVGQKTRRIIVRSIIAILTLSMLLFSCTTTAPSEVAYYEGEKIKIDAVGETRLLSGHLLLKINDEVVIDEENTSFASSHTFEGSWKGKPVRARATAVSTMFTSYIMLDVFIDGELVDTLSL